MYLKTVSNGYFVNLLKKLGNWNEKAGKLIFKNAPFFMFPILALTYYDKTDKNELVNGTNSTANYMFNFAVRESVRMGLAFAETKFGSRILGKLKIISPYTIGAILPDLYDGELSLSDNIEVETEDNNLHYQHYIQQTDASGNWRDMWTEDYNISSLASIVFNEAEVHVSDYQEEHSLFIPSLVPEIYTHAVDEVERNIMSMEVGIEESEENPGKYNWAVQNLEYDPEYLKPINPTARKIVMADAGANLVRDISRGISYLKKRRAKFKSKS